MKNKPPRNDKRPSKPSKNSNPSRPSGPSKTSGPSRNSGPSRPSGPSRTARPPQNSRSDRGRTTTDDGVFVVEGMASVAEYFRFRPAAVKRVYATKSGQKTYLEQLSALPVEPVILDDREESDQEATRRSPVWAEVMIAVIDEADLLKRTESRKKDFILALDHVLDPRNLGAIMRSAAFFGVTEVVVAERRQALLSNTSINTAQGGFAVSDLCVTVNVGRTLEKLKELGYWIVGADMAGERISTLTDFYEKFVLVMGSEESGLSHGMRGKCDRMVSIGGTPGGLESLNVSVAAGILLHGLVGSAKSAPPQ